MSVNFALSGRVVFSAVYGCGRSQGSVFYELNANVTRVHTGELVYSVKDRGREDPSPIHGAGEHEGGTFELSGQWKQSDHDTGKLPWSPAVIEVVTHTDRVFVAKVWGAKIAQHQDWIVITAARVS